LTVNPFAKRDSHSKASVLTYKILTTVTWLLSVIVTFYYAVNAPEDGVWLKRTIWGQNRFHHTAFSVNSVIASIYW
jgi:hypothetical protein